jgi:site-specific recombinase XerD
MARDSEVEEHVGAFAARLKALGYAALTYKAKVRIISQFGRWAATRRLRAERVDERWIEKAVKRRPTCVAERRKTLHQFLDYLRERGIAASRPAGGASWPTARVERRYEQYLRHERGLVAVTVSNYLGFVHSFLAGRFGRGAARLKFLTHRDVADFMLGKVGAMSPGRAKLMGTALRSFLRFLFLSADTVVDLSLAVPSVRQFRQAAVPKYLVAGDVEKVLNTCDVTTPVGRRDRAILLLLARLGLRAGEVVKLELGDIHWRTGELVVRGKGSVHDRLPLPQDVGEALVLYLKWDRPPCASRAVFLRMRAPRRGLAGAAAVTTLVERAVDRSGLSPSLRGAHLLRHSLATGMIRRGATMAEIGQLLRHRSPNTTELYAKVDFEGLRGVSLPWPGGAP